jgi:hypothetical protein
MPRQSQYPATVPGAAAEVAIPMLTGSIKAVKAQRDSIAGQVNEMLNDFPLAEILVSMPGVIIKTAASILLAVGD